MNICTQSLSSFFLLSVFLSAYFPQKSTICIVTKNMSKSVLTPVSKKRQLRVTFQQDELHRRLWDQARCQEEAETSQAAWKRFRPGAWKGHFPTCWVCLQAVLCAPRPQLMWSVIPVRMGLFEPFLFLVSNLVLTHWLDFGGIHALVCCGVPVWGECVFHLPRKSLVIQYVLPA